MAADLRSSFHTRLDELDHKLASMFDLVADPLGVLTGPGSTAPRHPTSSRR